MGKEGAGGCLHEAEMWIVVGWVGGVGYPDLRGESEGDTDAISREEGGLAIPVHLPDWGLFVYYPR